MPRHNPGAPERQVLLNASKKLGEQRLVDLPNKRLKLPFLSDSDKDHLIFCAQHAGGFFINQIEFIQ